MGKRTGKLVHFKDSNGVKVIAVAYDDEQSVEFSKVKKVFIRYLGGNYLPLKDNNGKNIVGLKDADKLTIFGFVD